MNAYAWAVSIPKSERALQDQIMQLLADPAQTPIVRHFVGGAPGAPLPQARARSSKALL